MKLRAKWLSLAISALVITSMALLTFVTNVKAAPAHRAAAHHAQKTTAKRVAPKDVRCPKGHTKAKGSAIFSDVQFPDTLNPEQAGLVVDIENIDLAFDFPVLYTNTDKFVPDMITQIPTVKNGLLSKDGKTYTFHLKQGLVWSNGTPIVAADWKLGWNIEKDPLSGPACTGNDCEVTRVDVPNKYTAVFHLKHPDAGFITVGHYPEIWPTSYSNSVCSWNNNAHDAANCLFQNSSFNFESTDYPFSGPYLVSNVVNNDRVEYVPNPKYNILNCGAAIKSPRFAFYSDNNAMIAAAAAKQTDITQDYTLQYRTALLSHKTYKTLIRPAYTLEHLELNHDATYNGSPNPIANAKVRVALALAINKAQVLASALSISESAAKAFVGYSPLIVTKTFKQPFADKAITGQWDPLAAKGKGAYVTSGSAAAVADAKKLLSQAGFGSGFKVDFQTTTRPATRLAEQAAICQNWQAIGVTCNALQTPAGTLFATWDEGGTLDHGKFQVALFAYSGGPDPEGYYQNMGSAFIDRNKSVHSAVNANDSAVQDKIVDNAYKVGDYATSNSVRQKAYTTMQIEMVKQAHWIVLYYRPVIATTDGVVKNVTDTDSSTGPEWNAYNWKIGKG
jgi:ABC-type transport system substrate-binding protein